MSAKEPPIVPPRHNKGRNDALGIVISEIARHEEKQSNVTSSVESSLFDYMTHTVTSAFSFFKGNEIEEIEDVEAKREVKEEAKKEETFLDSIVRNVSQKMFPDPTEEETKLLLHKPTQYGAPQFKK